MINMKIKIVGAKENNLKNINIDIPLKKMVVITGVSGSGKSSLAFDTIYKEGQRLYLETFSSYARGFIGNFERPKVDYIRGLSPVISIEQKTISKNPRSTVGTITEIYDYLRLLYSKISKPISFLSGKDMIKQDFNTINKLITKNHYNNTVILLSPIIKARKGHYNDLFQTLIKKGFLKVQVDGQITKLEPTLKLDRYKNHDIEIVIDKLTINDNSYNRLKKSIKTAIDESNGSIIIKDLNNNKQRFYSKNLTCPNTGISYKEPEPNSFSFNSPKGYCNHCKGVGYVEEINLDSIINSKLSILEGGIEPIKPNKNSWILKQIDIIGKKYNFKLHDEISTIPKEGLTAILNGINTKFTYLNQNIGIKERHNIHFEGIIQFLKNEYYNNQSKIAQRWLKKYFTKTKCDECNGHKLKVESLHFLILNKNISEISEYDVEDLKKWCNKVQLSLNKNNKIIGNEILKEINKRLDFLINVGLGYITISRKTETLSGGESQRIKIASQIGSELTNILYVLDEPSIGLHPKDNILLINSLKKLQSIGNSIIIVEHDKTIMESSDMIIDIGPKAGDHGGEITFSGTYKRLKNSNSITSKYINQSFLYNKSTRNGNGKNICIKNASGNNLKNIDVSFPLGKLILVTGVSGSGKSTLINGTLYPIISQKLYKSLQKPYPFKKITGLDNIDKIININQSPIGRTSRSNPATYVGLFTHIRQFYSNLKESKIKGYSPSKFSFNVKEGACLECNGHGSIIIQMKLIPDIETTCQVCLGKKFNNDTLAIKYKKKNIFNVLDMSVDEAVIFFNNVPIIKHKLKSLQSVGMGYIKLGQTSTKLSGGEAQRIKLASELAKKSTGNTLYIFDEPTTGLHFFDIEILMKAINMLVDKGNTVIIIEHNLDVIKQADHIIDLGPNGGKEGGEVICCGNINQIINNKHSHTALFLKKEIYSHHGNE